MILHHITLAETFLMFQIGLTDENKLWTLDEIGHSRVGGRNYIKLGIIRL